MENQIKQEKQMYTFPVEMTDGQYKFINEFRVMTGNTFITSVLIHMVESVNMGIEPVTVANGLLNGAIARRITLGKRMFKKKMVKGIERYVFEVPFNFISPVTGNEIKANSQFAIPKQYECLLETVRSESGNPDGWNEVFQHLGIALPVFVDRGESKTQKVAVEAEVIAE
jgi:hypothetical protein